MQDDDEVKDEPLHSKDDLTGDDPPEDGEDDFEDGAFGEEDEDM